MSSLEIQFKQKIATIVCILCITLGINFALCCGCSGKYLPMFKISLRNALISRSSARVRALAWVVYCDNTGGVVRELNLDC